MGPRPAIADFLVNHGYAVVTVDARGTGASFGTWQYPFSPEEIADYGQVVTWVTRQPWSDGTVGAVGFSYKGTTAELLTTTHPHAVKAVVPQELEFDLYTDTCLPGGILNACFMKLWDDTNHQLDANRFPRAWGLSARFFVKGVRPVDGERGHEQLEQAITEHGANTNVYQAMQDITYRDDPFNPYDATLDDMSPFRHKDEQRRNRALRRGAL